MNNSISNEIGTLGGLNAPVDLGLGMFNPTPMGLASLVAPPLAAPSMVLSAVQALSNMINQQQEPAPIEEASVNAPAGIEVGLVANPTAPVETAIAPTQTANLQAMNESAAAEDEAPEGVVSIGPLSMVSPEDVAAMAAEAATASQTAGVGSEAGHAADGNDAGAGAADGTAGVGSEAGHAADGNNSGGGGDPDGNGTGEGGGWYKGGQIMNYAGGGYASPNFYPYSQPTMMAEGGLAAAKRTQDAGRGPDSMLVHMAPQEVAGLQALAMAHGGSLTINPKTGLPEAGFLSSLLPTLVGAALTVGSGGTLTPLMAAGIVGGGTALATGSLKKGLFAGLGAFGGGSMGLGFSAAGAPGTVEALAAPASEAATLTPLEVAQSNIDRAVLDSGITAEQALNQGMAGSQTAQSAFNTAQNALSTSGYPVTSPMDIAQARVVPGTVYPGAAAQPIMPEGIGANFEQAGKGLKNVFQFGPKGSAAQLAGESARTAFSNEAGLGSISSAFSPLSTVEPEPLARRKAYIRPYDVNVVNRSAEMAPLYGPGSTSGREMVSYNFSPRPIYEAAAGGLMDISRDGYAAGGLTAFAEGKEVKKSKKIAGDPYYKFSHSRKDTSMEAALDANFAKGGSPRYLNGAGDGMSDSIPAIIDGKQPARLADGEFVIPADVVSHLGNGSSKAGAKKLYAMMDRIRKVRTGKKSQAPEVKSERYMPA